MGFAILGIIVGMGFASFTDIWFYNINLEAAWAEFVPVFIANSLSAIVLIPVRAIAWERCGQDGADRVRKL